VPVATPIAWTELARRDLHARTFTVEGMVERLADEDP